MCGSGLVGLCICFQKRVEHFEKKLYTYGKKNHKQRVKNFGMRNQFFYILDLKIPSFY